MSRRKNPFKEIFAWTVAGILSILLVNLIVFPYHHLPASMHRTMGSTSDIWQPGSFILNAEEGIGFYKTDKYGFLNDNLPVQKDYTLVVGSSHTMGKEVPKGERFSDILNDYLGGDENSLAVYNLSKDNELFQFVVNDFKAITEEYKDAKRIVIQIDTLSIDTIMLNILCSQHEYNPMQKGDVIYNRLGRGEKLKMFAKNALPIVSLFKDQKKLIDSREYPDNSYKDMDAKKEAYNNALSTIRSQWDKELIIAYHPPMTKENGDFEIETSPYDDLFRQACKDNGITFVDTSEAVKKAYEDDGTIIYGFANTEPGEGHLNKYGHKIMADEIFKAINAKGGDN